MLDSFWFYVWLLVISIFVAYVLTLVVEGFRRHHRRHAQEAGHARRR